MQQRCLAGDDLCMLHCCSHQVFVALWTFFVSETNKGGKTNTSLNQSVCQISSTPQSPRHFSVGIRLISARLLPFSWSLSWWFWLIGLSSAGFCFRIISCVFWKQWGGCEFQQQQQRLCSLTQPIWSNSSWSLRTISWFHGCFFFWF